MSNAIENLTFISLITVFQTANAVEVIDLGTLGGASAQAFDINDSGHIVGWSHNGITWQGFLWQERVMKPLTTIEQENSQALAINNDGLIAGWVREITNPYFKKACYWKDGKRAATFTLNGGSRSEAHAINTHGVIVGYSETLQSVAHAISYTVSSMNVTDLGAGPLPSHAYGINERGMVVGGNGSPRRAHLLHPLTALEVLPYSNTSVAYSVNGNERIVGMSDTIIQGTMRVVHPVRWENGVIEDLLGESSTSSGTAFDINDTGVIVGEINNRAAVWRDGVAIDLNGLLPSEPDPTVSPWRVLVEARAINNNGWIVGSGEFWNGTTHAFLVRGLAPSNAPPVSEPGPNQAVHANLSVPVYLDGGDSADDHTTPAMLEYVWSFTFAPPGSNAVLVGANTSTPSFFADAAGDFMVQLVVTDEGGLSSAAATVTVTASNAIPTANAGSNQTVVIGRTFTLDGSGSSDADGDALLYTWAFSGLPDGSEASISGINTASPAFVPDIPGKYVVNLVVSDDVSASLPSKTTIEAVTLEDYVVGIIVNIRDILSGLARADFDTPGHRNAMLNFLDQAEALVLAGDLVGAREKLLQGIIRTDGHPLRSALDTNGASKDWIINPTAQYQLHPLYTRALDTFP